jgi:L-lactate dehydrogenase complex protein LldG
LGITEILNSLGVELIHPNADKHEMALCDLGITEADFLLSETGTLVLRSSAEKPRAVSLLPRIHLAIVRPEMLRADMHQVFAEAKDQHYLVFITGPSRTADIELTVTLGVHGPKSLYVWMISP